jgi:hypothetical protein
VLRLDVLGHRGAGRFTKVSLGCRVHVTFVDLRSVFEPDKLNFPQGPSHGIAQDGLSPLLFAPWS